MRYASVCDGIGAVHVAWQPLGWECALTSEIDPFPSAVVEQRWGFVNRGDMTKFKEWSDEAIDLLVGGTPCQSFSVAGLRKGLHDPRGGLMLTFLEIAQRYRPQWVVWENVPGVLSSNGGRDFGSFLGALGELGYGWAYRVLDAQWFGVAQRRRRVFVVGCFGDERRAAQVLFESESVRRDNPPSRENGQRTSGPIAGCSNGGGANGPGRTADDADSLVPVHMAGVAANAEFCVGKACTLVSHRSQVGGVLGYDIHGTLAKKGASETDVHSALRGRTPGQSEASTTTVVAIQERAICENPHAGPDGIGCRADGLAYTREARQVPQAVGFAQNQLGEVRTNSEVMGTVNTNQNASGRNTPMVMQAKAFTHSGYSNQPAWITGDRTDCLPSSGHGDTSHQGIGVMQPVAFCENQRAEVQCVDPPHALASGGGKPGQGYCGVQVGMAVRRLTPRECERLQGFPDDYTLVTYRNKPAADGPRYKALGNSMAVPVMRWIGERIEQAHKLQPEVAADAVA